MYRKEPLHKAGTGILADIDVRQLLVATNIIVEFITEETSKKIDGTHTSIANSCLATSTLLNVRIIGKRVL
jgi:hypothetical protein